MPDLAHRGSPTISPKGQRDERPKRERVLPLIYPPSLDQPSNHQITDPATKPSSLSSSIILLSALSSSVASSGSSVAIADTSRRTSSRLRGSATPPLSLAARTAAAATCPTNLASTVIWGHRSCSTSHCASRPSGTRATPRDHAGTHTTKPGTMRSMQSNVATKTVLSVRRSHRAVTQPTSGAEKDEPSWREL